MTEVTITNINHYLKHTIIVWLIFSGFDRNIDSYGSIATNLMRIEEAYRSISYEIKTNLIRIVICSTIITQTRLCNILHGC